MEKRKRIKPLQPNPETNVKRKGKKRIKKEEEENSREVYPRPSIKEKKRKKEEEDIMCGRKQKV